MSKFHETIGKQIALEDEEFQTAVNALSSTVSTRRFVQNSAETGVLSQLCSFLGLELPDFDEAIDSFDKRVNLCLRKKGFMKRRVTLEGNWYKDGVGPLLVIKEDGAAAFLKPGILGGYTYKNEADGKTIHIGKSNKAQFEGEAFCFYRALPQKKLSSLDLMKFILTSLSVGDFCMIIGATLFTTLLGLFGPIINKLIFSQVVPSGNMGYMLPLCILMLSVAVSTTLLNMTSGMVTARVGTKMDISVESAAMVRLLSLKPNFFADYNAGELSSRLACLNSYCGMLASLVLTTGLTSLFSLIYIGQIFTYAPSLVIPSMIIIALNIGFSLFSTMMQMKITEKSMKISADISGFTYAMLSGIQKIKLAAAERRAFTRFAGLYAKSAKLSYNPPLLLKINPVISLGISSIGTLAIYYFAVTSGVSVADYMAFQVSFGMVSGAMMALSSMVISLASIKPVFDMARPLLDAEPEVDENKQYVSSLAGDIRINNVSFAYGDGPVVLDNLSFEVRRGEYVGIVGKTGCGKSTLLRLLMGFESPSQGAIYYDNMDIGELDVKSLRSQMGIVIQNGRLLAGDIFSNIIIASPRSTLKDAWAAAELAGIAEDIRAMPMGMNTLISEGSGGVSGGQRQRLLIARAVCGKPHVLFLDEATSALDNLTQKHVADSLEKLGCTRIVIAHRLSTIQSCNKILVLDKGKIIASGTYSELLEGCAYFAELVKRQTL